MRIDIDVDGVLYPWTECANEALVARFGIPNPGEHRGWNWLKEQVTREQWAWLWSKDGQRASFGQCHRRYPGVREAFGALLGSGHEVHFVTHRDPALAGFWTALLLENLFGGRRWAGTHVLSSRSAKHALMEWDAFVDDRSDTVMDFLIQTRAQVFAPVRTWNADLEGLGTPRLIRYVEPREVTEWVLAQ